MLLFGMFYVVNCVLTGGWKEDLLEAIDADVLPVIYGGTRTDEDGDPRCRNLVSDISVFIRESDNGYAILCLPVCIGFLTIVEVSY